MKRFNNCIGATQVEAAIVLPLFFLLLFLMFELSAVLRQYQAFSEALRLTGREISIQGCSGDALDLFKQSALREGMQDAQIQSVDLMPIDDPDGVPGINIHATATLNCVACNVFSRFTSAFTFDREVFYPRESSNGC